MSPKPGPMTWLWAPWRLPYLRRITKAGKPPACFFCDYAAHPRRDRKNLVVLRDRPASWS